MKNKVMAVLIFIATNQVYAQSIEQQERVLNLIRATAKDICEIPLKSSKSLNLTTVEAQAKVAGLVKRLADAGVSVKATLGHEEAQTALVQPTFYQHCLLPVPVGFKFLIGC